MRKVGEHRNDMIQVHIEFGSAVLHAPMHHHGSQTVQAASVASDTVLKDDESAHFKTTWVLGLPHAWKKPESGFQRP